MQTAAWETYKSLISSSELKSFFFDMAGAFICFLTEEQTNFSPVQSPNSWGSIQTSIIAHKSETYATRQMSVEESYIKKNKLSRHNIKEIPPQKTWADLESSASSYTPRLLQRTFWLR